MQVNAIPLPGEGVVLLCPSSTTLPVSKGERKDHFAFTSGLHGRSIDRNTKNSVAHARRDFWYNTRVSLRAESRGAERFAERGGRWRDKTEFGKRFARQATQESRRNLPTPERKINLQLQNDRRTKCRKFRKNGRHDAGRRMPSSLCVSFKAFLTASPET